MRINRRFGGPVLGGDVSAVYLLEPEGLKKYLPVLDANDACVCSSGFNLFDLEAGEKLALFATFAAPDEAVEKMTVVVPTFSPISDVPIT